MKPEIRCVGPRAALTSFQGLALPARLERGDVVIVIRAKLAFGEPLARTHGEGAVTLAGMVT